MNFLSRSASVRFISLKAILPYLMQCGCSDTILLLFHTNYAQRIMFMQEFSVIDSATSTEQLRMRLKEIEFEQFGDPVLSEYVYDVINRLPRFSSMRVSS